MRSLSTPTSPVSSGRARRGVPRPRRGRGGGGAGRLAPRAGLGHLGDRTTGRGAERDQQGAGAALDAATEAFTTAGVGAPLESIAARAGVSIGTLYNHFPDRDALVDAVVGDVLDRLIAVADAAASLEDRGRRSRRWFWAPASSNPATGPSPISSACATRTPRPSPRPAITHLRTTDPEPRRHAAPGHRRPAHTHR
jgi:AcrR family transcriptional regulator